MPPEDLVQSWQRPAPFPDSLGIALVSEGQGRAQTFMPFTPPLGNRKGNVHGGAIATLADMAMGHAIRSALDGLFTLSTVTMTVNYLAPGSGDLTAEAVCTKPGKAVCFAAVDIISADGTLAATATGVFRVLRPTAPAEKPAD